MAGQRIPPKQKLPLTEFHFAREKSPTIMNLYILRHASAGTRRVNPRIDVKRPLDKEGKQQCMLIGTCLNALNVHFDLIASSPLKRALQTASLVGTEIDYEPKILITEALSPDATIADFQQLIAQFSSHENVLVVGHNPNLQEFLGSLVSTAAVNGSRPEHANIRLRKGALARVDCTRRPATLNWLLDARMLRTLYSSVTRSSRRNTSKK
jgi:phosphohistidine phosphatase